MIGYKGAGLALVTSDTKGQRWILLGCRKFAPDAGRWTFPGGGHEADDGGSLFTTASREFLEETSLFSKQKLSSEAKHVSEFRIQVPFFHWQTHVVEVPLTQNLRKYTDGSSSEFDELRFFRLTRLPQNLHPLVTAPLRLAYGISAVKIRPTKAHPKEVKRAVTPSRSSMVSPRRLIRPQTEPRYDSTDWHDTRFSKEELEDPFFVWDGFNRTRSDF